MDLGNDGVGARNIVLNIIKDRLGVHSTLSRRDATQSKFVDPVVFEIANLAWL